MKLGYQQIYNFFYCQSPSIRLSKLSIHNKIQNTIWPHKFWILLQSKINYSSAVFYNSKCYLCKLPIIKNYLRYTQNMHFIDHSMEQIQGKLLQSLPQQLITLKRIGKYLGSWLHNKSPALSLLLTEEIQKQEAEKMLKFLTAIQCISLGYQFHNCIGSTNMIKPNLLLKIILWFTSKVIKDKHLVLAGDYFHIKASVLGAQTNNPALSCLLAEMQIDLCKQQHLKSVLSQKIVNQGYNSIEIDELSKINKLKISQFTKGLIGLQIIKNQQCIPKKQQIYQCLGLIMLYRKQLENFIYQFSSIQKNYTNKIIFRKSNELFCLQYNIINYLFYQSVQKIGKINQSFINAIEMMTNQIKFLQKHLELLIGNVKQSKRLKHKVNYIEMMYV